MTEQDPPSSAAEVAESRPSPLTPPPREMAGAAPISLDAMLRHWARERPQAQALADAPDKADLGLGPAYAVTFGQADTVADRIAHNFADLGLEAGDVIALQLPNTVEALLVLLGSWRAGLTVAPLSPLWRLSEIDRAFSQTAPRAVVTMAQFADHAHGRTVCQAAVDHLSIRFAFGFGADLPDAVAGIDDWLDLSPCAPFPSPLDTAEGMDRDAILTWSADASGPVPVPRSHGELTALACVFLDELRLTQRDSILSPFPPVSAAAIGGLVGPWLLSGARLLLHQPFSMEAFLDQLLHDHITYTALPAAAFCELEQSGYLTDHAKRLARVGCVWPVPAAGLRLAESELASPVFDIHNFAERGVLVRRRRLGEDPTLLPLGPVRLSQAKADEPPYLELRIADAHDRMAPAGELRLRGPTVPRRDFHVDAASAPSPRMDGEGYVPTGIAALAVPDQPDRCRCERSPEMIQHGGIAIAAHELDELYAGHPDFLDAAAFGIDDPVMGERIVAAVVPRPQASLSLEGLRHFLAERQVAPYKLPDHLIEVSTIPRDAAGRVARGEILRHVSA